MIRISIVGLALLAAVGCSSVGGKVDRQISATAESFEAECECWEAYGWDSASSCLDFADELELSDVQRECVIDAVKEDRSGALDNIECTTSVLDDYRRCVESSGCDVDVLTACVEDLNDDSVACPNLPVVVEARTDDCFE